jgi:transposase
VKKPSLNFAVVKAFPRVSITSGRLEAGKHRLAGDTARAASTGEVTALRRGARELKEVVAEQSMELRLLKKSMIADGGDDE